MCGWKIIRHTCQDVFGVIICFKFLFLHLWTWVNFNDALTNTLVYPFLEEMNI